MPDPSFDSGPAPGTAVRDWYAYQHDYGEGGSVSGAGWSNGKNPDGSNVQELYYQYGAGDEWVDPVTGKTNHGVAFDGGMVKMGEELGTGPFGLGWDVGAGTANGGVYNNDSIHSAGVGMNLLEASVTAGDAEDNIRFGVSAGEGAGLRIHHGDADNDGVMEAGFGIDYGFGSFDIKSEFIGALIEQNGGTRPQ